jgi:hypothetical protein
VSRKTLVIHGVTTKALNQAVRRNFDRFPADLLFQLTDLEAQSLRSPIVTEHGAIMAATILNSPRAAEMNVYVVRAFVELRAVLAANIAACSRGWLHLPPIATSGPPLDTH